MAESENTANTEMNMAHRKAAGTRRESLDAIRGAALISMIAYHACWDLVWIFGVRWNWYRSYGAYLWQQSICWTFILLSGYCFSLSRRPFRRGVVVFACGALVTAVTVIFMPDNRVFFGVLSLLGSAILLTAALSPLLRRIPALCGCFISFALFFLTRHTSGGTWCFGLFRLPARLYRNDLTACFGFPPKDFFSTDYFPLLPWLFLFWTGYYLFHCGFQRNFHFPFQQNGKPRFPRVPLLAAIGRHSLLIYLLHQPVIYGVLTLISRLSAAF